MENKNYFEQFYLEQEVSIIAKHYKNLMQQLQGAMEQNNSVLYTNTLEQIVQANEILTKRGILPEVLQLVNQK